jgi:hypothetical protein
MSKILALALITLFGVWCFNIQAGDQPDSIKNVNSGVMQTIVDTQQSIP